jgi:hypothetical protein
MAYRHGLHNFSKGVLSKELWGRSDIAPYAAAVRQGINVCIQKYGGLTKRPGTRFVYEIRDANKTARLLPFEGAYEASYVMTLGQAVMRLAALGGMVVEEKLKIEAISADNPAHLTVSYHGLSTGDEVFISGNVGADALDGLILPVTVLDASHFTVPVNGAALSALVSSDGIVRGAPPSPPPPPPPVPPPPPPPPPPLIGGGGGSWRGDVDGGDRR